jgi:nucleoside-diphosphate-sugar epimerase
MRPNDGRVVSNFVVQALRGEPLTVYGDGSQTRSFCYATDEVDGIYRLFMSDYTQPVNIGNPDEFTVLQLAELRPAAVPPSRCPGDGWQAGWHAPGCAGSPAGPSG